ncbi:MAG: response regulator transcription factor [Limnochorda sp.]|uniref:response regulator transcription factor n=1 Tax=Limnochorda pilosa TaxID=1555112 RepID=UPI001D1F2520|nr:response regulator transcription factor [Limnochorda pilosa]MBO2486732.1 DNA-binding response regulator [Bacillota bacterium]MBO2519840.1 DNA-binding response regulator [Bacillota bacterium]
MRPVETIRILIVDDHEVVRIGLRSLLERIGQFEVVGEAASAQEAIELARSRKPDVVVMDIRMPDGSGIEACRAIRSENEAIKVIMLTSYTDDEAIFASVMAGASGYVLKQIGSHELVEAIRTVAAGGSLLDPSITGKVLERMRGMSREQQQHEKLTDQELRILRLIADGRTNKEIAEALYLSEKTVRNYVSSILSKLNLSNRAEAAAYAVRRHLLDEPDPFL